MVGTCVAWQAGGGPAASNSTSSTTNEYGAISVGEKLTSARLMVAFGTVISRGVLTGRGVVLGARTTVACPICAPLAFNARKRTVRLVSSGYEYPTQTLTRRWPLVKLISIGALQNSAA